MSGRLQSLRSKARTSATSRGPSSSQSATSAATPTPGKRGLSQVEPREPVRPPVHAQSTTPARTKKPRTSQSSTSNVRAEPQRDANTTSRRTRPSNDAHPALTTGVPTKLPETRQEISARTSAKRTEHDAKREVKRASEMEKKSKVHFYKVSWIPNRPVHTTYIILSNISHR